MDEYKNRVTIAKVLFIISSLYITFKNVLEMNALGALLGLVSLLFLLVPNISEKVLKIKLGNRLRFHIIIFMMLSFNFGIALSWYQKSFFYDKFVHLLSGVLFAIIGLCLYAMVKKSKNIYRKTDWLMQITYAVFFASFISVLWETMEFSNYLILGRDSQHHLTTGVFDTMGDLISSLIGSIILAIDYYFYIKRGKSLSYRIITSFDDANMFSGKQDN